MNAYQVRWTDRGGHSWPTNVLATSEVTAKSQMLRDQVNIKTVDKVTQISAVGGNRQEQTQGEDK